MGDALVVCDGFFWNGTTPVCQLPDKPPSKQCNFAGGSFCDWSQVANGMNDTLDWKIGHAIENATMGTGPDQPFDGPFIYVESSGTVT